MYRMPRNTQKRTKRNRRSQLKHIGGGCSCGGSTVNQNNSLVKSAIYGGSNILAYPLNNYEKDPSDQINTINSRNLPNMNMNLKGGSRRNKKQSKKQPRKQSKKSKKMRGGNLISSFGSFAGAFESSNFINGGINVNSAPHVQPVLNIANSKQLA